MISDSVKHYIDSVVHSNITNHIKDTVNVVNNNMLPDKPWTDNIFSIFALIISIGSLITTIIYSRKQLKNSHVVLERTIKINTILAELDTLEKVRMKAIRKFFGNDDFSELKTVEEIQSKRPIIMDWYADSIISFRKLLTYNYQSDKINKILAIFNNLFAFFELIKEYNYKHKPKEFITMLSECNQQIMVLLDNIEEIK